MKKFLLSLAAVTCAASMSATSYTLFDINNAGEWAGAAQGWGQIVSFGDKKVTITTDKATSSNDLVAPNDNTFAWRIYKNSSVKFTAEGISMKKVVITYDDYSNGQYVVEMVLSDGWTGSISSPDYTLTSAGLSELVMTASNGQGRVKKIVASDTDEIADPMTPTAQQAYNPNGGGTTPDDPELPEGVIYSNTFESNLDGWEKINDESLSDFNGWKINGNSPKCAICNSYYGGSAHPADSKMQYTFDLKDYTNVELSFDQAFGYDFPQSQNDNYRVYVISGDNTEYLTMANFPAAPASGNWSKEWPTNTFDLSEYDGTTLTIGFRYMNDGSKSGAWELKNFVLKGEKNGIGVAGVTVDENVAPVYYNLQGVRVANPENGLFIVVKGSKVSKVVL